VEEKKPSRPWDIFNANFRAIEEQVIADRTALCDACPELIRAAKVCKKCGCHMPTKIKLTNSFCPIGKWDSVDVQIS